jgi:hypothetical protein
MIHFQKTIHLTPFSYSTAMSLSPEDQQTASLNGPALLPPPGVVPELDHSPTGNAIAIPVLILALIITSFVTIIRIYARAFVVQKVCLEDGLALIGYVCSVFRIRLPIPYSMNAHGIRHRYFSPRLITPISD